MELEIAESRKKLRFIGIMKDATTAGPGKRMELFLKGCIRGIVNPCEGCFNPTTWQFGGDRKEMSVDEVVALIVRDAWNKQVTFCGGEPLLQARNLIHVASILKKLDPRFHIVVYTAYNMESLLNNGIIFRPRPQDGPEVKEALLAYSRSWNADQTLFTIATPADIRELMKHVDLIVDGDYQADKRLPTIPGTMNEGMFIGSSNQRVINTKETLKRDPYFVFEYADAYNDRILPLKKCKCCGHPIQDNRKTYCDDYCKSLYRQHEKEIAFLVSAK